MPYSFEQYTGDGVTVLFSIPFPYIERAHISVTVDGVLATNYTYPTAETIQFSAAPALGSRIEIRRSSSPGLRVVDYLNGSKLLASVLNKDSLQAFYLMQEALDSPISGLQRAPDGTWEANSLRLKNLGTPVLPADAVSKQYVDSLVVAAGSVPPATPGTDDWKSLVANGGSFTWRNPVVINMLDRADPTGVNDATAAFQAAIDSGAATIDLGGGTYKVSNNLVLRSNLRICNGTLDASTGADGMVLFQAYGSLGTQYTLTAAPTKGSAALSVSSASGLADGDLCILRSNDNFSPADSGKRGEWVRLGGISGLTVNLRQRCRFTYTSSYTMYKPVLLRDITLENLRLVGKGYTGSAAQYGLRAYLCSNINVINCHAEKFGYAAYSLETCFGGTVEGSQAHLSNYSTGAAYGVAITGGCDGVSVIGGHYTCHRHAVSVGGTLFTCHGINVSSVNAGACSDAGIDVHPNAINVSIDGNTIDCYSPDTAESGDGIVAQCADVSITDNKVRGWRRIGILIQPLTTAPAADDGFTVDGNQLTNPQGAAGADGIVVDLQKGGIDIRCAVISNNRINGESASTGKGIVVVNTTNSSGLRGLSITGNSVVARSEALYMQAANLHLIQDVVIDGNSLVSLSAALPAVSLIANAEVSKYLSIVKVGCNIIRGGSYGVSLSNSPDRVTIIGATLQGFATAATLGTFVVDTDNYSL